MDQWHNLADTPLACWQQHRSHRGPIQMERARAADNDSAVGPWAECQAICDKHQSWALAHLQPGFTCPLIRSAGNDVPMIPKCFCIVCIWNHNSLRFAAPPSLLFNQALGCECSETCRFRLTNAATGLVLAVPLGCSLQVSSMSAPIFGHCR